MTRKFSKQAGKFLSGSCLVLMLAAAMPAGAIQTPCGKHPGQPKSWEGPCTGNLQTVIPLATVPFQLVHNSQVWPGQNMSSRPNYGFGPGFNVSLNNILTAGASLVLESGDGTRDTYIQRSTGLWTHQRYPSDDTSQITMEGGKYVQRSPGGGTFEYSLVQGSTYALTCILDVNNRRTTINRQSGNALLISTIVGPDGETVTLNYGAGNLVSSVVDTYGQEYKFSWATNSKEVCTPDNICWSWAYDTQGRQLVTGFMGPYSKSETAFSKTPFETRDYDYSDGTIKSTTLRLGLSSTVIKNQTVYTYSSSQVIVGNPSKPATRVQMDYSGGAIAAITNGATTGTAYPSNLTPKVSFQRNPAPNFQVRSMTQMPESIVTEYVYQSVAPGLVPLPETIKQCSGPCTTGKVVTATTIKYNNDFLPKTVTQDGVMSTISYPPTGNLVSRGLPSDVTDGRGNVTVYTRDGNNLVTAISKKANAGAAAVVVFGATYDPATKRPMTMTDENGVTKTFTWTVTPGQGITRAEVQDGNNVNNRTTWYSESTQVQSADGYVPARAESVKSPFGTVKTQVASATGAGTQTMTYIIPPPAAVQNIAMRTAAMALAAPDASGPSPSGPCSGDCVPTGDSSCQVDATGQTTCGCSDNSGNQNSSTCDPNANPDGCGADTPLNQNTEECQPTPTAVASPTSGTD